MTTPLFPDKNTPITIAQGKAKDCYLLTALDCVLNLGQEGLDKINSLFTETDAGITVRIKRSLALKHLQSEKMAGKYEHHVDMDRNEDVFFIDRTRIDEIDQASRGVKSNALAIKILERIISYYFVSDWDASDMDSVAAHGMQKRSDKKSSVFVADFLGIEATESNEFDKIIKLKTICPEYPIYLGMRYGQSDAFGKLHRRHALRVDKIVANDASPGGYDFILINPWDNTKRESYSLDDIKKRKFRFCFYSLNKKHHQLITILSELPVLFGQLVFADSVLFNQLVAQVDLGCFIEANKKKIIKTALATSPLICEKIVQLTIQNLNLEFFNFLLIANYDFLAHFSSIERFNDFIGQVVNKEKAQQPLSVERLQCIASYLQRVNTMHNGGTLDPLLNNQLIFDWVIEQAIKERTLKREQLKPSSVKRGVESRLKRYYLYGEPKDLTSSGKLREHFFAKRFDESSIEKKFSSEVLIALGLADFINGEKLSKRIADQQIDVSDRLFHLALTDISTKNTRDVFVKIQLLVLENSLLAIEFFKFFTRNPSSHLTQSFDELTKQVSLENSSEFKTWFEAMSSFWVKPVEKPEMKSEHNQALIEQQAKQLADQQVKQWAEQRAKEWAEPQAKQLAEQQAKQLAEQQAKQLAEQQAKQLAEQQAKQLAEQQAKQLAEQQAKQLAEQQAKQLAEQQAKQLAEQQAKQLAEQQAKQLAEQQAKQLAEQQAKQLAEQQAKQLAEQQAKQLAEQQAKQLAEQQAKQLAEQQAKQLAEQQAKQLAEQQAKHLAERQAKQLAEQQAKQLAEQQAKQLAEQQAKQLQRIQAYQQQNEQFILQSDFNNNLDVIKEKADELARNQHKSYLYISASHSADALYRELLKLKKQLFTSLKPTAQAMDEFCKKCHSTIQIYKPVLETHRGWKEIFANIGNVLLNIASFGLVYLTTGRFGFFAPQTDSAKKVNDLQKSIESIATAAAA